MRIAPMAAAAALSFALVASAAPAIASPADHKPIASAPASKDKSEANKKKGKAKFALRALVISVDADSVVVKVKGGNVKRAKGKELDIAVAPDARIKRDEVAATLADLQAGDRVNVKGKRVKGEFDSEAFTATKNFATSPDFVDDDKAGENDQV
ncbi:MAG: hypothetical protein ACT4PP_16190 [Sporichthyaceae bacterium]